MNLEEIIKNTIIQKASPISFDEFMDLADENLAMQELILIIHNLEAIQDKATQLLAPFAENLH